MKISMEDYLHKIDLFFKDKEPKETYMMYLMLAASIFAVAYVLFYNSSLSDFKKTRKHVKELSKNISNDERYLMQNPQSDVIALDNEIIRINEDIIKNKDKNDYIKAKIETISFLIYDDRTWGEYLKSISTNAQKYNVKIIELTNKFSDVNSDFGHLLDITIQSRASFKNTLKFINSLEQSDLVVDLHDFTLDTKDLNISFKNSLNSDLNISVWGIRY